MVLQWANVMVLRWACAVNGGRHVVFTVVTVGANVGGNVFVSRWRCLNFLGVPNDDGFLVDNRGCIDKIFRKNFSKFKI